ncbi:uncharacterized protein K489DRAFT_374570 [Dissoconium aciculare CBS 342.82]|uniref:Uncharacterized protein n=1 Tax=Dissoconium aciculare CBS 342.82 TaxID=1314786 RepID=A0A6J3LQH8_9PEZI|nr:uncharacterized protein K489DRAFT_374570 [Dissoconium aciculare CBS 342.82]KAF1818095.1 hypothetical protein K489DRAFT_374570 [Dissoconium aciculare CBS 342.82]
MDKVPIEDRDGTLKAYEDREATQCIVRSVPIMETSPDCNWSSQYHYYSDVFQSPLESETTWYPDKVILEMGMFPHISTPEAESFVVGRERIKMNVMRSKGWDQTRKR